MRVKMTISYDGSHFYGFQVQNSGVETVANRLYEIFRSLGIEGRFEASGRTDRGVHATGQVLSLDLPPFWRDFERLKRAFNQKALPHIYAQRIEAAPPAFHARYDAKKRAYRYLVSQGAPSVFRTPYLLYTKAFDPQRIAEAITLFEGAHDFTLFAKTGSDVDHYVRTIFRTRFYRHDDLYVFGFEADGYLRAQIRLMVSFLLKIGRGELACAHLLSQLSGEKRYVSEPIAPNGLYLSRIWY
ncbi:MAG TPA: tRNA pseudouridine(38-40) synthase TruA [Campylobacteraceae bacterium]|nr:tRNA pseudouridine(38-40) synthase TruA [Campylobacteraceae bacterium]